MSSIIPIVGEPHPEPIASHDEVVKTPALFWDSLQRLHSATGTKYMVPNVGGIPLDVHALYVEVTKRGGYDQVVSKRKWREISSAFGISPTITSVSYVLKKHYQRILYCYEQLYFLKQQGPTLTPGASVTFRVTRKIDNGYEVSVNLGTESFYGVIYQQDHPNSLESARSSNSVVPYDPNGTCTKRRKRKRDKDPDHPKPNRTGYNFYFADKYCELKSTNPGKEREFAKMIGESWRKLSLPAKNVYNAIGMKDKERYQKELKEYKDKMKDQDEADKRSGQ